MPALQLENGELLTEMVAVLQYIAESGGKLLPSANMNRWRALELTAFVSTEIHKNFNPIFYPGYGATAAAHARELLVTRYKLAGAQLGEGRYFTGNTPSIGDLYLFVSFIWARIAGILLPSNLESFSARIAELPSVITAFEFEEMSKIET